MELSSHQLRTICGFWLLGTHSSLWTPQKEPNLLTRTGLINNVLYVIILSAALDLVGPTIPKGLVLLADVLPSFLVKLTAPYYIHVISYPVRVVAFVALSAGGMLVIALSADSREGGGVAIKLFGVALASLSSGGGELSFLGLTHWYGQGSLAAWSSGTGAAGLVGAGAYVLVTGSFGLNSRTALLAFAFLPVVMVGAFFGVLPKREGGVGVGRKAGDQGGYVIVPEDEVEPRLNGDRPEEDEIEGDEDVLPDDAAVNSDMTKRHESALQNFMGNLRRAQGLFIP